MFGRVIIKPDLSREPTYDNINPVSGQWQNFSCVKCGQSVALDMELYVGKAADAESVLGPKHAQEIRRHFGREDKSLRNGWPKFCIELCPHCQTRYLAYVAEFEPRNGWLQATLQGVTELIL